MNPIISIIIYLVLILICAALAVYYLKKLYNNRKEEKKIQEIIQDPEKLYNKLKEHDKIIDDGKEVDITLKEDPATGKKVLDIKLGKHVIQDWRSRFEKKPESKEKPKENKIKAVKKDSQKTKHPKQKV